MPTIREQFDEQGYYVFKGLFDPAADLQPLIDAYGDLIKNLTRLYLAEADEGAGTGVDQLSFPEQFAVLLGASRGAALHQLDPVLNVFAANFTWRRDLPDPRVSELFDLMRQSKLLDVIEQLIGPEIAASPIYHVNVKLAKRHLQLVEEMVRSSRIEISKEAFYKFQIGKTGWHMDAITVLADAHESDIVNAWIPLTPATAANGCLMVIPGSHKFGVRYKPYPPDLDEQGLPVIVEPGDVVFLDNKIMHCSLANRSDEDYRWAFNFRYLRIGQPTGRPYLPGFIARSRSAPATELRDGETWRLMWGCALDYLDRHGIPTSYENLRTLSLEEAQAITRYWTELAPDPESWLKLGQESRAG